MNIIGMSKSEIIELPDVKEAIILSDGFKTWFNDKFMKYEGFADHEDVRVLIESLDYVKALE